MGKKSGPKRPGAGPTGGSSGSGNANSGLVVVNPMTMQSALRAAPSGSNKQSKQKQATTTKKRKADGATGGKQQQQKKSKKHSDRVVDSSSSFTARKFGKRAQKSPVVSTHVSSVVTSAGLFGSDDGLKRPISLIVQKEEHLLAGAYWIALSRGAKRSCVVVVPTSMAPQSVAGAFRNVGFQALAIHKKMTMGQRKEAIERLASSMELVSEASQVVLVTPEHFAGATTVCTGADVLLLNVKPQQSYSKFSAIFQVMTSGDVSSYRPELTSSRLQQVSARLKLASQITEIAQRLGKSNAKDVDSKWANKLAKGADLSEDDDEVMGGGGGFSDNEDGDSRKKKSKGKKKALSPDEQRLQALTEKLVLLVARKLDVSSGKKNQQLGQGNDSGAAMASDNNQNGKEKLEVLGLVTLNAAVGASLGDERLSAQTQWMDAASGQQFGGAWDGSVRHGASKDASSLALRKKFCAVLKVNKNDEKLSEWKPNKNPSDLDTWGGEYGKVCGHNEVVMQSLRPFYPQEVLNSKVCSRMFPAPGNQGFDGCLEHLRLQCMAQKRAMTLWDAEYFIYITGAGQVTWTKKNQLLALSLASLQCAVSNLRSWTLASQGRIPPKRVVQALQVCCELGSGDLQSPALEMKLLKRVMSFAIGGSVRLWKQIAKLPQPLEEEIVY